jgi:hypothetical protein
VVPEEIHSDDRKVDGGEEKGPLETAAMKEEGQPPFAPALDGLPTRTGERRPGRRLRGLMREDGEAGSSIHKETPL